MAHTNIGKTLLRWSTLAAEREFQVDRKTIAKRLSDAEISAGEDGLFKTTDIAGAIYGGDLHAERLRECRERADNLSLKNKELRGDVVDGQELRRSLENLFTFLRQEILGNQDLTDQAKKSLLSHLEEYRPPR